MDLVRQLFSNKRKDKAINLRFGLLSRVGDGSFFEGNNSVGKFSFIWGRMGGYSYLGDNAVFMGSVGRFSSISSHVHVVNGRHPIKAPFVSTSPVFYAKTNALGKSFVNDSLFEEYVYADLKRKMPVIIGNDCWIGYGASIIGGVTIGDGAIILANATVTKDVPPYAIVGGVPARVVGFRYDEETIQKLLDIKWWDRDINWIKENFQLFSDIDSFLSLY